MVDIRLEVILIALVIIGALLLIIAYTWVFIIQRSPLRLIQMVLRNALDRDRLVDPDAPIALRQTPRRAQSLIEQGQFAKQSALFADDSMMAQSADEPPAHHVPRAPMTDSDIHAADETTSDNGWPIPLDKTTRQSRRPFLHIQLDSEKDPESNQ